MDFQFENIILHHHHMAVYDNNNSNNNNDDSNNNSKLLQTVTQILLGHCRNDFCAKCLFDFNENCRQWCIAFFPVTGTMYMHWLI